MVDVSLNADDRLTFRYHAAVMKHLILTFCYCVTIAIDPVLTLCYCVTVGAEIVLTRCRHVTLWIFPGSRMCYLC